MRDYRDLALVNGGGNPKLARDVARQLGVDLVPIEIGAHRDGEPNIGKVGNFRGKQVIILTSWQQPDRNFITTAIQADIARRAAPKRITSIVTYHGYSRQDRRDQPRTSITVEIPIEIVAKRLDEIYHFDLHSEVPVPVYEVAGEHKIVVDHLYSRSVKLDYLDTQDLSKAMVMSMDLGGGSRARSIYSKLREMGHPLHFGIADKWGTSSKPGSFEHILTMGTHSFDGLDIYGIDDQASTATTAHEVSSKIRELGARSFTLFITHPVFPDEEACQKIADAPIDRVVVTDSVPISDMLRQYLGPKLVEVSLAPYFSVVVDSIYRGTSISRLFFLDGYREALNELTTTS